MENYPTFRSPKMRIFCEIFAHLLREAAAKGQANPKVGRRAAMLAGYGGGSWNENRLVQTADTMYAKLVRREDVKGYLRQLGVERVGRHWQLMEVAACG